MKVLLINGSPNEKGCTYTALREVEKELAAGGLETEIFHIGSKPVQGCIGCGKCKNNRCVFDGDSVNRALEKAEEADAYIFGSPVYYASASGQISSFLDRFFFSAGNMHAYKPGAVIVSCRRAGSTAAIDQLQKYLTIKNMPVVSSKYWNMVHGTTPEQVMQDKEGIETMHVLGKNMVWMLKNIEAGRKAGVKTPVE